MLTQIQSIIPGAVLHRNINGLTVENLFNLKYNIQLSYIIFYIQNHDN